MEGNTEFKVEMLHKNDNRCEFINQCQVILRKLQDRKTAKSQKETKLEKLQELLKCLSYSSDLLSKSEDNGLSGGDNTSEFGEFIEHLTETIYDCGKVQQYKGKEDVGYVDQDFIGIAEISTVSLQCFYILLTKLFTINIDASSKLCKCVIFYAFLLCCEHQENELWTSESSINMAQKVLQKIQEIKQVPICMILCGRDDITGIYNDILSIILLRFTRHNWKQNPSMKQVYMWCLLHVKCPELSDHLEQILPPALLLVDDHEVLNKQLGIRCLDHIIENTSMTELTWFGRADVIYDSLQKLTYTHESLIINVLHPCMLKILAVLEKKSKDNDKFSIVSRYDKMFQQLLSNMELETKMAMRRAYSQHLASYITALGINTVKHFRRLFRIIYSYLEVYDGPHEQSRINILNALKQTILVCWPRIPGHCEDIIKSLMRLIFDTSTDRTVTPDDVKNIMITDALDCLILVKRLSPERTILAFHTIREVGLGSECNRHIDTVLMAE